MYIESKGDDTNGSGRIGWVEYSKSMRSIKYKGRTFKKCAGYKYNCVEVETGITYWITGPKIKGGDKLYGGKFDIDEDARVEYRTNIRKDITKIDNNFAE